MFLGTFAFAVGSGLFPQDLPWSTRANDAMRVADAMVASEAIVAITQMSFARQRPYAHFGGEASTDGANTSFVSSHTAMTFALVTSAVVIAHQRRSSAELSLWTVGYALAGITAYFRMAADQHYLTDVLAGAAVGVASGVAVPLLEERINRSAGTAAIAVHGPVVTF